MCGKLGQSTEKEVAMHIRRTAQRVFLASLLALLVVVAFAGLSLATAGPPVVGAQSQVVALAEQPALEVAVLPLILLLLPGVFLVPVIVLCLGYGGQVRGFFAPRLLLCFMTLSGRFEDGFGKTMRGTVHLVNDLCHMVACLKTILQTTAILDLASVLHETERNGCDSTTWENMFTAQTPLRC
jgi:hypothetical protein